MTRALDRAAALLCLLAAICAENIPLMLTLVLAAGACIIFKGVLTMPHDTYAGKEPSADRRRCHELLDSLCDPALVARAYRFIKYVYTHGNKKTAPGVTTSKSGKAE